VLRHWVLIDLECFRKWATDEQVKHADLIDNHDGTFGRAFDLRSVPPEMLIAASMTMQAAINAGRMNAVELLQSGPPRLTTSPPDLQELVAKYGRYDLITAEAWAQFDAEKAAWRERYLADRHVLQFGTPEYVKALLRRSGKSP
jgi:hypothetical protein